MWSGFRSVNGCDGDDYDDDIAEEVINCSRYRSVLGTVTKLFLYVRPSAWNSSTPTGQIFMKNVYFSKNCRLKSE